MTDFFDGRTLGCEARLDDRNPWFWRGPGYDEGWAEVTDDELRDLQRLLDAYFGVERHDERALADDLADVLTKLLWLMGDKAEVQRVLARYREAR